MPENRHYRVARCGQCEMIVPYRRRCCTRCGAADRVYALASLEELERARLLQGLARNDLRVPREVVERPPRTPVWQQLLNWPALWFPQLIGRLQRR